MAKTSFSTRLRHDSNAVYNEWVTEFVAALAACGLVQTSDTGQLTPGALTRTIGVTDGYQIWRFNDAMQSTAPIFLKFRFGTQSNFVTSPRLQIEWGTGSNGSGTITATGISGTMANNRDFMSTTQGQSAVDTGRPSHFIHEEGFFGMSFKNTAVENSGDCTPAIMFIARTVDNNGDPTADGAMFYLHGDAGPTTQAVRFASSPVAYTAQSSAPNNYLGFLPQAPTNSNVGSDTQVALAWTISPLASPLVHMCGVYPTELALLSTFNTTLVGSDAHDYIVIPLAAFGAPATMRVAMLWD